MTTPLIERTVIAGLFLHGKEGFQNLLAENFGDRIPQPGTGDWPAFVFACRDAPRDIWIRTRGPVYPAHMALPASKLPMFPKVLEQSDYFLPYTSQSVRSPEPFWIGFWSSSKAKNPYKFPENSQAWENGHRLARTQNGELYRVYITACEAAEAP